MNWKYWVLLIGTFGGVNGWHMLNHTEHPFWGGVCLGLAWCCGKEALKDG